MQGDALPQTDMSLFSLPPSQLLREVPMLPPELFSMTQMRFKPGNPPTLSLQSLQSTPGEPDLRDPTFCMAPL